MGGLSAIKLKRTDTTLDLSQEGKSAMRRKENLWRGEGGGVIGRVDAGLVV